MNQSVLNRIHALNLDPFTETAICEIVQEAIDGAAKPSTEMALQIPGDWPECYRDVFWSRYPNKKAKPRALKVLDKIAFSGKTRWADLINGLNRYISSREVRSGFVKHPATWLNDQGWKDEEQTTPLPVGRPKSFFEVASDSFERSNGPGTDQGRW